MGALGTPLYNGPKNKDLKRITMITKISKSRRYSMHGFRDKNLFPYGHTLGTPLYNGPKNKDLKRITMITKIVKKIS